MLLTSITDDDIMVTNSQIFTYISDGPGAGGNGGEGQKKKGSSSEIET
jgi:hypothetical protein